MGPWRGAGLFGPGTAGYHGRMRITCPACTAAYDVPDAQLAPGRGVQCARCGSGWVPVAPAATAAPLVQPAKASALPAAPPPAASPTDAPAPAPADERPALERLYAAAIPPPLPQPPPIPRGRTLLPVAWAATLMVLAGLAAAAVTWRTDVMRAWPPSERLYAALGLVHTPAE